ncbi:helix-turn-helix domain-containing protein [Nocardia sp. NPDC048505]|uniref:helix-turn-helix domain-containing protein n=1 Tax=Nocardia sp. NPDC048505 TaxID=3155756 RepID=UPI0033D2BE7D
MAMSARTLRRRLGEHGTSWRNEVEAARLAKATALLRDTGLPVSSVATRVGYSDARALRRAFPPWTGHTPARFRAPAPD